MRACAVVSIGERTWVLGHGDLIGRLWSAALCLDDPRLSEAHAMVSLRDRGLQLLSLRRRIAVGGKPVAEVTLTPGLEVELAEGVVLRVDDITLPTQALAIEGDGLPRQALLGVCSLFTRPRPSLAPGYEGDADGWIWTDGERWTVRARGGDAQALAVGDTFTIRDLTLHAVSIALQSQQPTRQDGGLDGALHIVAWYDSIQVGRAGEPPVIIGGVPARIVSELVALGGPAPWEVVAGEVWPTPMPTPALRRLWDVNLSRLRARLRDARVRTDLVQADGAGQVRLVLHADDVVDDHT